MTASRSLPSCRCLRLGGGAARPSGESRRQGRTSRQAVMPARSVSPGKVRTDSFTSTFRNQLPRISCQPKAKPRNSVRWWRPSKPRAAYVDGVHVHAPECALLALRGCVVMADEVRRAPGENFADEFSRGPSGDCTHGLKIQYATDVEGAGPSGPRGRRWTPQQRGRPLTATSCAASEERDSAAFRKARGPHRLLFAGPHQMHSQ